MGMNGLPDSKSYPKINNVCENQNEAIIQDTKNRKLDLTVTQFCFDFFTNIA